MAHFFFDYRDNDDSFSDDGGLDMPDSASVQIEAARALAQHAVDVVAGPQRRTLSIEVRDKDGPIFATRMVFEMVRMRDEPNQHGREMSTAQH